jgi:hypothetical protein
MRKRTRPRRLQDLSGQRFGRLVVIRKLDEKHPASGHTMFLCQCDCGQEKKAIGCMLLNGNTRSCGCLAKESGRRAGRDAVRHGMYNTKVYHAWISMKGRCLNPRHPEYPNYGGRGITVCQRWKDSFENFLADMGVPFPSLSLDRIDNSLGYSPDNCRWATVKQQANNKRGNAVMEYCGERMTKAQWAERLGLSSNQFHNLLRRGPNFKSAGDGYTLSVITGLTPARTSRTKPS